MAEKRVQDVRRKIWMGTPGWLIHAGASSLVPPNMSDQLALRAREQTCLGYATPCVKNLARHEFEIVVPSPNVSENHTQINKTVSKYSRGGTVNILDFEPQFIYTASGINTPRYKTYLSFTHLPQYLGQALVTFLNFACADYIYLKHIDGSAWIFYYAEESLTLENSGRDEFMTISVDIERWGLV